MESSNQSAMIEYIDASKRSVRELLKDKKYTVDYYQREYRWQTKHVSALIADLTSKFLQDYDNEHEREEVQKYGKYFLGPIIVCRKGGGNAIVDGQQRLTTLTLLLVYLDNLQHKTEESKTVVPDNS